ncbi:MAG: hypothetical protein DI629_16370 [Mesorhizobium amorphae]|nr:MAG: hypothetical protein DI629_16370 [Mesorhizobium amorphae]
MDAGIARVLVDLEKLDKAQRQAGKQLHLSALDWDDVAAVRAVLPAGALMVRLDPLHENTRGQIDKAIDLGADRLMLPYFSSSDSVFRFCDLVAGRVPVVPLVERVAAVHDAPRLMESRAVAEFHVGMNDLAIDCGAASHLDLWTAPLIVDLAEEARRQRHAFGIGGVTDPRCSGLPIDPGWIIAQQARLGSSASLLGRHFRSSIGDPDAPQLTEAVAAIQELFRTVARDIPR